MNKIESLNDQLKRLRAELDELWLVKEVVLTDGWKNVIAPRYRDELQRVEAALYDFNNKDNYLTDRQVFCLEYSKKILLDYLAIEGFVKMEPQYLEKIQAIETEIKKLNETTTTRTRN